MASKQAWVLLQQSLNRPSLLADAAEPAAVGSFGLQLPLQQMAEQHAEPAHQLTVFLACQGFQFLLQASPIEAAAVVIAQGGALHLHPTVEITLMERCRHGVGSVEACQR